MKGVASVNGGPANPPDTDNVEVRDGDVVTYRLDLHNDGSTANDNAVDVLSPEVWDVLPARASLCSDISAISDGGVCTDPGDAAQPTFSGSGTHSAIRWQLGATPPLAPGAVRTLNYDMTIPADASVQTSFPNTAAVRSYETATNRPGVTVGAPAPVQHRHVHRPARLGRPAGTGRPPRCTRRARRLDKSNVTDITEPNNGLHDAVVGETLTYTLSLRVPAHTAIFNGVLTDPMPTGVTYLSSTATLLGDQHVSGHGSAARRVRPEPGQRHAHVPAELRQQHRHPAPVRGAGPRARQHADRQRAGGRSAPTRRASTARALRCWASISRW